MRPFALVIGNEFKYDADLSQDLLNLAPTATDPNTVTRDVDTRRGHRGKGSYVQ